MHSDEIKTLVADAYRAIEHGMPAKTQSLYSPQELAQVPDAAIEMALGVANHLRFADIAPGETILDLGRSPGHSGHPPPHEPPPGRQARSRLGVIGRHRPSHPSREPRSHGPSALSQTAHRDHASAETADNCFGAKRSPPC